MFGLVSCWYRFPFQVHFLYTFPFQKILLPTLAQMLLYTYVCKSRCSHKLVFWSRVVLPTTTSSEGLLTTLLRSVDQSFRCKVDFNLWICRMMESWMITTSHKMFLPCYIPQCQCQMRVEQSAVCILGCEQWAVSYLICKGKKWNKFVP